MRRIFGGKHFSFQFHSVGRFSSSSAHSPAVSPDEIHPFQKVLQEHRNARVLNSLLVKAISSGNCAGASTYAAELAQLVKEEITKHRGTEEPKQSEIPPPSIEDMDAALSKIAENLEKGRPVGSPSHGDPGAEFNDPPFWKDQNSLNITILETQFEVEDGDSGTQLLDKYLAEESALWKQQKAAIAKVVLDVAKECGLTPLSIHGEDDRPTTPKLNPLKHCNVVVRGELPYGVEASSWKSSEETEADILQEAQQQLSKLEEHLQQKGAAPLTSTEKQLVICEYVMAKSQIKYIVGLHRSLSGAIDGNRSAHLGVCSSKEFVSKTIERLNQPQATALGNDLVHTVSKPVLPFSFILKLCLWYSPQLDSAP
jgi:hypothetical protein